MTYVAVYGSLRKQFGNHRLLESADFVDEGATTERFDMHSLGGFPAIVEHGTTNVVVEVYDVDSNTFERLDMLEGYPGFYNRKQTDVILSSGEQVTAWIYFMEQDSDYINNRHVVDSGDWREFKLGY